MNSWNWHLQLEKENYQWQVNKFFERGRKIQQTFQYTVYQLNKFKYLCVCKNNFSVGGTNTK